jgi:hypothetical protein
LDSGTEAAEEAEVAAPLLVELAARGLQGTKLRSAGVSERLVTRLLASLPPVTGAAAEAAWLLRTAASVIGRRAHSEQSEWEPSDDEPSDEEPLSDDEEEEEEEPDSGDARSCCVNAALCLPRCQSCGRPAIEGRLPPRPRLDGRAATAVSAAAADCVSSSSGRCAKRSAMRRSGRRSWAGAEGFAAI